MLLVSTGFKAAILGPQSFAQIFNGGEIRLFAGTRPNSANAVEPSTPIAVITRIGNPVPGLQFTMVGEYVIKPPGDNWSVVIESPGTPTWFRLVGPGDDGGDDLDAPRIDGDIGSTGKPNDMTLDVEALAANTSLPFDGFVYTIPPLAGA